MKRDTAADITKKNIPAAVAAVDAMAVEEHSLRSPGEMQEKSAGLIT